MMENQLIYPLKTRKIHKYITRGLPFVTVKAAMSLDGKLATVTGNSKWITSEASRRHAHHLRKIHDAVLVGLNTVRRDDPSLDVRYDIRTAKQPLCVVLDSRGEMPLSAKLLGRGRAAGTIVIVTKRAPAAKRKSIEARGARVVVAKGKSGRIDIRDALKRLASLRITSVLVEGGSQVLTSFIEAKAADKIAVFIAPKLIGGRMAPTLFAGKGVRTVKKAVELHDITVRRFAGDVLIQGYPTYR